MNKIKAQYKVGTTIELIQEKDDDVIMNIKINGEQEEVICASEIQKIAESEKSIRELIEIAEE